MKSGKKITTRKFIKTGIFGTAGCVFAFNNFNLLANASENISLQSREALFFKQTPRGPMCLVCPNECIIRQGDTGLCRSRINKEGKIHTIGYGNPCAVHIDPIEKKPLYHFLPGTKSYSIAVAGCNLSCLNCQNWTISQKSPEETKNYDLMPVKLVSEAVTNKCKSIAYTYSEPITFFEYTYDSAKLAAEKGIKNVFISAGYINEEPLRTMAKVIHAANIDLKSMDDDIYLRLNGGQLQPVLDTLKIFKDEGVWLEITNLIIPEWTDNIEMIKKMCNWLAENGFTKTPLHFSRFYPQYKLTHLPPTPSDILHKAHETALKAGLKYVYIGNLPGENFENTICPKCKKIVVERKGFTILKMNIKDKKCIFCNEPVDGIWA